jgi:hypothetical protein
MRSLTVSEQAKLDRTAAALRTLAYLSETGWPIPAGRSDLVMDRVARWATLAMPASSTIAFSLTPLPIGWVGQCLIQQPMLVECWEALLWTAAQHLADHGVLFNPYRHPGFGGQGEWVATAARRRNPLPFHLLVTLTGGWWDGSDPLIHVGAKARAVQARAATTTAGRDRLLSRLFGRNAPDPWAYGRSTRAREARHRLDLAGIPPAMVTSTATTHVDGDWLAGYWWPSCVISDGEPELTPLLAAASPDPGVVPAWWATGLDGKRRALLALAGFSSLDAYLPETVSLTTEALRRMAQHRGPAATSLEGTGGVG